MVSRVFEVICLLDAELQGNFNKEDQDKVAASWGPSYDYH